MANRLWLRAEDGDLMLDLTDLNQQHPKRETFETDIDMDGSKIGCRERPHLQEQISLPHSRVERVLELTFDAELVEKKGGLGIHATVNEDDYCIVAEKGYMDMLLFGEVGLDIAVESIAPHLSFLQMKETKHVTTGALSTEAFQDLATYSETEVSAINKKIKKKEASFPADINGAKRCMYLIVSSLIGKDEEANGFQKERSVKDPGGASTDNAAIVVHGLVSSITEKYDQLMDFLSGEGYDVFSFDYLTVNNSISNNGRDLAGHVRELKEEATYKNVLVVAHSMGGLVSRSAMVNDGADIDQLIMAGTPNKGSVISGKSSILNKLAALLIKSRSYPIKKTDFKALLFGREEGVRELNAKSQFITDLNNREKVASIKKYFALSGAILVRRDWLVRTVDTYSIRDYKIPHVESNWTHFNYFTKGKLRDSVGLGIDYLLS